MGLIAIKMRHCILAFPFFQECVNLHNVKVLFGLDCVLKACVSLQSPLSVRIKHALPRAALLTRKVKVKNTHQVLNKTTDSVK